MSYTLIFIGLVGVYWVYWTYQLSTRLNSLEHRLSVLECQAD